MENFLILLKERYKFEIVKNEEHSITIRGMKSNALKLANDLEKIKTENVIGNVKLYFMGSERQYEIYKLFLKKETSLDLEKLTTLLID